MCKHVSAFVMLFLLGDLCLFFLKIGIAEASGSIYIRANGLIDPPTANITTVDYVTYTFTANNYGSIVIERDNIVVDGACYTLRGPGWGGVERGVDLTGRSNLTIENININSFGYGAYFLNSFGNKLSRANITRNWDGIYLGNSADNILSDNIFTDNEGCGISFGASGGARAWNNSLFRNSFRGNRLGLCVLGTDLSQFMHTIDVSNLVNGKPVYYMENMTDFVISPATCPQVGYLALVNCFNVTVDGLTLTDNAQGLLFVHTSNSKLTNNIIANNSYGIDLIASGNNTINGNTIANNDRGVELLQSSSHNIFFENTISMNNYGAVFYYGSSNNKFYHNSFTQNSEQASFPFLSYNNIWDNGYPSGGNYWSDYHGFDLNNSRLQNVPGNDGIGDRSYVIDANNKDSYPLMGVFSDFNANSEYHVQTICNSSISDFQFNGTAMSFNVTGKNSTIGFCRICIPTALVNCTYRVFVNGTEILPSPLPLPFSNTMHSYLYFTYHHSTQEVIIIPEFPSFLFLALFIIATPLAVTVYTRNQTRQATLHLP